MVERSGKCPPTLLSWMTWVGVPSLSWMVGYLKEFGYLHQWVVISDHAPFTMLILGLTFAFFELS